MESSQFADWQRRDIEALLILSTALSNLTATPPLLHKIPVVISTNLNLPACALVLIRLSAAGSGGASLPELVHVSHSNTNQVDVARQHAQSLLQSPDLGSARNIVAPTQISFYRVIDPSNALLFFVYPADALPEKKLSVLSHIADLLGYLVSAMNAATASPAILGAPFDKLTEREWVVLQGLQSVEGEKQLADKLELSPHTLHSHIKSIYRKLGVQGRLPMLVMMENAQRCLKIKHAGAAIAKVLGM